ncbi:hypothetical protein FXO38_34844 [Capsicum annuum]|nr:hypothetical protein FXO38_34844 [Capsicum annuum]KAF3684638.1 hypothetical protein FXO37_01253 [Capsicum annuum]
MEKMNQALEKMKMLVGMDVEDEETAPQQESSFVFMDDLNRNCTLSTKQRIKELSLPADGLIYAARLANDHAFPNNTSQMAALVFDDIIQSHYVKYQALVAWKARDHTWRGRLEHAIKQNRVWKIAWSLEDLRTLGFGPHLVVHGFGSLY